MCCFDPNKINKLKWSSNIDNQPSIISFFKNKNNTRKNLIIKHTHLNDTEINFNQNNTNNNKPNYDRHQPAIASNNIITKEISKITSLIGKIKTTTSLFIKELKDKKRKRNKQDKVKQLLKQEGKRNIRSTRNVYSIYNLDYSSNVSSDNSSLFYSSSKDSLNSSSDSHSNYKYRPISKGECFQSKSSASSNSLSIESALKYINNKVKIIIQQREKNIHPFYDSVSTSRGIKNVIHVDKKID